MNCLVKKGSMGSATGIKKRSARVLGENEYFFGIFGLMFWRLMKVSSSFFFLEKKVFVCENGILVLFSFEDV